MRPSKLKKIKDYYGGDRKKLAMALGITERHVYNIEKVGFKLPPTLQKLVDCLYNNIPKEKK